jgi:hypothetical protein
MGTKTTPDRYELILQQKGRSLLSEGVQYLALPPGAAMEAIEALREAGIAIVGGEVWIENGARFDLSPGAVWDMDRDEFCDDAEFLLASWRLAEQEVSRAASERGALVALFI